MAPGIIMQPKRLYYMILSSVATLSVFLYLTHLGWSSRSRPVDTHNPSSSSSATPSLDTLIIPQAQYFMDYPLDGPKYGDQFGEMGQRIQILRNWISVYESSDSMRDKLDEVVERVLLSTFPFLRNPSKPNDKAPFKSLQKSFVPGSRGIVIPTGLGTFRYACHLIAALRDVHHTNLPIQIFYAGDNDLPSTSRQLLGTLGKDIEFVNILSVFDDETLQLASGGWAIKAFAALASKFEQIILLDADAVLVQPPESVFAQTGYKETGVLLYHDRLLWQHGFRERHDWWKKQMEHQNPSPTLLKSLVWTEDYAEEGDSGLVVMDKSRLTVLTGLLHICWQNTYAVREETTYKITYGDKESWWFGLELSGAPYAFENHYGSIAGYLKDPERVCSFTIAHTDDNDKLLWYNGSLLKNKAIDTTTFEVPTHWMMDATWEKGGSKPEISCMTGGQVKTLTADEVQIIERMVEAAKKLDSVHSLIS
jgi:alpha 1,3-mannosyltransferase